MARRMMGALVTALVLSACGSSTPAATTPVTAAPYGIDGAVPPPGMQADPFGLGDMSGFAMLWGWPDHLPPADRVAVVNPLAPPSWALSPWWGGVGQGGFGVAAFGEPGTAGPPQMSD